jgi:hypothetical protein
VNPAGTLRKYWLWRSTDQFRRSYKVGQPGRSFRAHLIKRAIARSLRLHLNTRSHLFHPEGNAMCPRLSCVAAINIGQAPPAVATKWFGLVRRAEQGSKDAAGRLLSPVPIHYGVWRAREWLLSRRNNLVQRIATSFGCLVGIVFLAVVNSPNALSQQSLQELESIAGFERTLAAVDAIKDRKRLQCVLSTSNERFCDCLSRNLPLNIKFHDYALIVRQEKEGQEYGQLSAADKKIVDQCMGDPH